jgi:hypothetical protein
LEWSTGGPQGDTPATLARRASLAHDTGPSEPQSAPAHYTAEMAAKWPKPISDAFSQMPHLAGAAKPQSGQLLWVKPPVQASGPQGARIAALEAKLAALTATTTAAPATAPASEPQVVDYRRLQDNWAADAHARAKQFAREHGLRINTLGDESKPREN